MISADEKYDVFICCYDSDKDGHTTADGVIAEKIYQQLLQEKLRVFYSPVTLQHIHGVENDYYTEMAIANADVLLVIAAKEESFYAVPFKTEWERCAAEVSGNDEKLLVTCVQDISLQKIPQVLLDHIVRDIASLDFLTELIRTVRQRETPERGSTAPEKLLQKIDGFLEAEDFETAEEYCRLILEASPQCWQAHFYSFLAYRGLRNANDLLLEEVVNGFACEYVEKYGFDITEEDIFHQQFENILGGSLHKALEYSAGDDRLRLTTIYDRFAGEVLDAVFLLEQKEIDNEEKQEFDELRRRHETEKKELAAIKMKKQRIQSRFLGYIGILLTVLIILAVWLHSKWLILPIVIIVLVTSLVLSEME